jgi:thiol-disulfide isomerase/thioredoxin/outer membrane lipoprotein-sorting protein
MFARVLIPAGLMVAAMVSPALAQVDEAAKDRLKAASEAVKAAGALSFKAQVTATGTIASMMPTGEGTVTMLRPKAEDGTAGAWIMRATGKGQAKGKDPSVEFDVAWLAGQTRVTDFANKKVHQTPGKGRPTPYYKAAEALRVNEFVEAEPFKKAMNAPNISLLESATVGGVACDVVETGAGKGMRDRFFIAKDDNILRRVVRIFDNSAFAGEWTTEITDLSRPTDLTEASFEYPVPAGFTEEKTAPAPTPTGPRPAATGNAGVPGMTGAPSITANTPKAETPRTLAPDFELADPAGNKVTLASLRGNIVLLDFWGTWCIPCRASHKELAAMEEAFKDKPVKVLSLSVREKTKDAPVEYMKKNNYTFGLLLEADKVAELYNVKAYPTFVLIGKDGQVLSRLEAFKKDETIPAIKRMIEEMLTTPDAKGESGRE